jgi:hypothetical protein
LKEREGYRYTSRIYPDQQKYSRYWQKFEKTRSGYLEHFQVPYKRRINFDMAVCNSLIIEIHDE